MSSRTNAATRDPQNSVAEVYALGGDIPYWLVYALGAPMIYQGVHALLTRPL